MQYKKWLNYSRKWNAYLPHWIRIRVSTYTSIVEAIQVGAYVYWLRVLFATPTSSFISNFSLIAVSCCQIRKIFNHEWNAALNRWYHTAHTRATLVHVIALHVYQIFFVRIWKAKKLKSCENITFELLEQRAAKTKARMLCKRARCPSISPSER